MNEGEATKLDQMTTAEIAAAIEVTGYWRQFFIRTLYVARTYAFSCVAVQYLLFVGVGMSWVLTITLCVFILEHATNRFTLQTYSTSQIVDLLLKRATLEGVRNDFIKNFAPGLFLFGLGFTVSNFPVAIFYYHICYVAGILSWLAVAKTFDNICNSMATSHFSHTEAAEGRFYVKALYNCGPYLHLGMMGVAIIYFGFAMLMALSLLIRSAGGFEVMEGPQHGMIIATIVFSIFGCGAHETVRFHAVQGELNRLLGRPNVSLW